MRTASSVAYAVVAFATAGSLSCASAIVPAVPVPTREGVRFIVSFPEASRVALAGSFNEWSESSHLLVRQKTPGVWSIVVVLPPGEHHFMYVVDGRHWVSPPLAEDYADDGFGSKNGIVVVDPASG